MEIEAEISYYALGTKEYGDIIDEVIKTITSGNLKVSQTPMSTIVLGPKDEVLKTVDEIIEKFFSKYGSILEVKFSNSCPIF